MNKLAVLVILLLSLGCSRSSDPRLVGHWDLVEHSSKESIEFYEDGGGRFLLVEGSRVLHQNFEWRTTDSGELMFTRFDEEGDSSGEMRSFYTVEEGELRLRLDYEIPISDSKELRFKRGAPDEELGSRQ